MTHFEKQGLFLGLLSYPYNYDGKELYKKLKTFFENHKNNLWKYETNSRENNITYKPAGYRMFGSQGLAILSIVDDYTFYNRHFNKNHIQSCIDCDDDLVFNTTVISGITESQNQESYLIAKAKNTFLRENNKYHFIGIIRVKINHDFLLGKGKGVDTLRKIKRCLCDIENKCKKKKGADADHIAIDCFDNDEMTIIAFSNDLLYLYNFLGEIRSINNNDIHIECKEYDEENKCDRIVEKHVFGSALLCFGYDVDYDPSNDASIISIKMRCLIETKSGHRDALFLYLSNFLGNEDKESIKIEDISKNITGGCNIVATLPLNKIIQLEKICQRTHDQDNVFLRDVRRMKVVLMDINHEDRLLSQVGENHASSRNYTELRINKDTISATKSLMKQIGISKLVRERLMALYELYNNACQNLLQQFYLQELQQSMKYFYTMIKDMKDRNEQISKIEETLNIEIRNMENAIYDRLHIQKQNQPPLEYSGGIQQYLTSFDYAYKYICNVFSPNEVGYVTITGAERASSARCLFNLNINDIVFPELFITTAWKEVANFAIKLFEYPKEEFHVNKINKDFWSLMEIWHNFSQNEESFETLRHDIIHSDKILPNDKTCEIVMDLMKEELLMYFFKDYLVFHFAFLRNYKLLWHYFFKTMLQTSICYIKLNEVNRMQFIHVILRLFMVGLLSNDNSVREFINNQAIEPFDHILGDLWMKDYNKVWEIAQVIYNNLEHYGFKKMNDCFILIHENNNAEIPFIKNTFDYLNDSQEEINNRLVERKAVAKTMVNEFNAGVLIANSNKETKDYIICMFYAYLEALYELDKHDRPIKSIHRDLEGKVPEFLNDYKDNYDLNGMNVLIDPTGGFFIPSSDVRENYFQLRTVLYRSLWNYRYTNEN